MSKVKKFVIGTVYLCVYCVAFSIGFVKGVAGAIRAFFNGEMEAYLQDLEILD